MNPDLLETLRLAQRLGFFGPGPIEVAAEHAVSFVDAIGAVHPGCRIVDIGSGGGLPGLVVADALPGADVTLVDRREKRSDFLARAVRRLDLDHVQVRCADVGSVAQEVRSGVLDPFDIVTARGFGPPVTTLAAAVRLLAPGGRIVISEPPSGDRWPTDLLDELGLTSDCRGAVRVFRRHPSSP